MFSAEQPLRIMPLGASNTQGMAVDPQSPGGYRGPLQAMLAAGGVPFDFVGSLRGGAIADPDHEGHGGMTIDWYAQALDPTTGRTRVEALLDANPADVVLLLVGTNDVNGGDSAETMIAEMVQLLRLIDDHPADPAVFVMKLQPLGPQLPVSPLRAETGNEVIERYNTMLGTLVGYTGSDARVVDMLATSDDLSPDGIHLNAAGYLRAAAAWDQAIDEWLVGGGAGQPGDFWMS
ncbi:SGNH/GDSL hydrolase family protein [Arenibaculum pallidiluteum]|uniref:SGNH/GDSL hydrolase family protein n=1 Tax=Arenibaculum pallidiluteum TaxID=2812559 RepID=UPI001A970443|nr:GDSL-type esterase/lipase family protein [Arenibaculum pallidiluteum]